MLTDAKLYSSLAILVVANCCASAVTLEVSTDATSGTASTFVFGVAAIIVDGLVDVVVVVVVVVFNIGVKILDVIVGVVSGVVVGVELDDVIVVKSVVLLRLTRL